MGGLESEHTAQLVVQPVTIGNRYGRNPLRNIGLNQAPVGPEAFYGLMQ